MNNSSLRVGSVVTAIAALVTMSWLLLYGGVPSQAGDTLLALQQAAGDGEVLRSSAGEIQNYSVLFQTILFIAICLGATAMSCVTCFREVKEA